MDSPAFLLQRRKREATTGQSLSAWLCHLVPHGAGGSRCPTAAPKWGGTLCSQRCAHAGKALYHWRQDFKGQKSRTEREQPGKGQPGTVTLQNKDKMPCYSQKTKKPGERNKETHTLLQQKYLVPYSGKSHPAQRVEGRQALCMQGKAPCLPRHQPRTAGKFSCSRATLMQQHHVAICFWLNV